MKRALAILVVAMIAALQFTSCKETVTETKWKYDTTLVHDTMRSPAFIRFVSLIPDEVPNSAVIQIWRDAKHDLSPFSAKPLCLKSYYAVPADSSIEYLLNVDGNDQHMPLEALAKGSINTFALFLDGAGFTWFRAIDTEKIHPPPPRYCYVRLINAITDHSPYTPLLLDIDHGQDTLFHLGVPPREISHYELLSKGAHIVAVGGINDPGPPLKTFGTVIFQEGEYYTFRARGSTLTAEIDYDLER